MFFFQKLFTSSESQEKLQVEIAALTDKLKGIKVNGEDLFTYLNNYCLLTTLYSIINVSITTFSEKSAFTGAQGGYEMQLHGFLKNVKDINYPPPYIISEDYYKKGDIAIANMINDHIDKYNTLVPLLKKEKKLLKTISSLNNIVKELEQLCKDSNKYDELNEKKILLQQYKYGISYLTNDIDFQEIQKIEYESKPTPQGASIIETPKPVDIETKLESLLKLEAQYNGEIVNYLRVNKNPILLILETYIKDILRIDDSKRKMFGLLLKYEHILKEKTGGTGSNTEPIKTAKKQILGKERCIYKKTGDRKEYVKYKGNLITVKDYRTLMKKKASSTI